jgi:hypothetical protein
LILLLCTCKGQTVYCRSPEGTEETDFSLLDVLKRQRTARDKESYGEDQRTLGRSARLQILLFLGDKAELAF